MAERSTAVVSCGLSLLSSGMISNLTPEAFFLLKSSAISWKVLSWFVPTAAIRPDNGSIQPIFTVSPFCAQAPDAQTSMAEAAATECTIHFMTLSPFSA